jgi:hypothetical protein
MEILSRPKIKAAVVALSDIEKFADILIKISEEESKNLAYKMDPQFEIEYKNGRTYKFITKEEFIEQLKSELLDIKKLELYFKGKQNEIWFYYSIDSSQLYLEIKSNQKESLLNYEEDIKKLFKKDSWNWVVHKLPFLIASFIFSFLIFLILLSPFLEKPLYPIPIKLNLSKLNLSLFFLGSLLGSIFSLMFKPLDKILELYPLLVIIIENDSSGRIFKKDLWKIIIVIITLITIPILINKFFP